MQVAAPIKLVESPVMAINETKQYTTLLPERESLAVFSSRRRLNPSSLIRLQASTWGRRGFYEISGITYLETAASAKSMSRPTAARAGHWRRCRRQFRSKAFTRFRMASMGQPAGDSAESRATDEAGNVGQPARDALIAERGPPHGTPNVAAFTMEHFNAITSWGIDDKGEVSHVYA